MSDVKAEVERTPESRWMIEVRLEEDGLTTVALARLRGSSLEVRGNARRNPLDPDVPLVGEDIAAARALSQLSHVLLQEAASELEAATHEPGKVRP
jgi:hypothetical protein